MSICYRKRLAQIKKKAQEAAVAVSSRESRAHPLRKVRGEGWATRQFAHFRRTPPTSSCMSTPLLLSIQAAMKVSPAQVLPV
jgi:hypothetical protein